MPSRCQRTCQTRMRPSNTPISSHRPAAPLRPPLWLSSSFSGQISPDRSVAKGPSPSPPPVSSETDHYLITLQEMSSQSLLDPQILASPNGFLSSHPSLLLKYRGPSWLGLSSLPQDVELFLVSPSPNHHGPSPLRLHCALVTVLMCQVPLPFCRHLGQASS